MKINEVKVNGKLYKFDCGLDFVELWAKELDTQDLGEIIAHFNDIEIIGSVKLDQIPKLSEFVRKAIIAGCGEDLGDLNKWVYSNTVSVSKVVATFISSLPGQGESDKEMEGNVEAVEKAA